MSKILLEDNLQQNFVSMTDAVIEIRFWTKILCCHTGVLKKKFRGVLKRKQDFEFLGNCYYYFFKAWQNEIK